MKSIKPEALHELITKGENILIVDVRSEEEHQECCIKGAKNIHIDEVTNCLDEFKNYEYVFFHCGGGGRSGRACTHLEGAGCENAVNIEGGLRAWKKAGLDVECKG